MKLCHTQIIVLLSCLKLRLSLVNMTIFFSHPTAKVIVNKTRFFIKDLQSKLFLNWDVVNNIFVNIRFIEVKLCNFHKTSQS